MKLDGFGVFVKDMAAMIRFYRDVLGFEIKESEDADNVYSGKGRNAFPFLWQAGFRKNDRAQLWVCRGSQWAF